MGLAAARAAWYGETENHYHLFRLTFVMRTLDTLPARARAIVAAPATSTPVVARLLELGLTPGTAVEVVRRAPFGDPIEISLRGTRLCLRRADAAAFGVVDVSEGGARP